MILLEKLYNILSNEKKPTKHKQKKSLNYYNRKKEIGRINVENRSLYKAINEAKPSLDLKKIGEWNKSMEKYRKNISCSSKRKNPYRPIVTQGVAYAYPELRPKTTSNNGHLRKLSAEIPSHDYFSHLLKLEN